MKLFVTPFFILLFAITGCGKQEPTSAAVPKTPPKQTSMPALQPVANATAPPAQAAAAAAATAPPTAVDLATAKRPLNAQGDPMSDLEMLNHILANYQEARATLTPAQNRTYKTEAEQMAAETAQARLVKAPIRDLSELVKAGVIKALPTPPAGKKFAIDPQSQKVVLVNAP